MAFPPRRGLGMARGPAMKGAMHDEPDMDQMGGPSDGDADNADYEMGYGAGGGEGQDDDGHDRGFQQWQAAVEQDRRRTQNLSDDDYDKWDMQWRERAKKAGLDQQEVDAFMDSLWEGRGSEPSHDRTPEWEGGGRGDYRRPGGRP